MLNNTHSSFKTKYFIQDRIQCLFVLFIYLFAIKITLDIFFFFPYNLSTIATDSFAPKSPSENS